MYINPIDEKNKDKLNLLIMDLVTKMQKDYSISKREGAFSEKFYEFLEKVPEEEQDDIRKKVIEYTKFLIVNHKNNIDYKNNK